jgi:hypothetical protein
MKDIYIDVEIVENARRFDGIVTVCNIGNNIVANFKFRDLVCVKLDGDQEKKKKVVGWRKKTVSEINDILNGQDWT